VNFAQEEMTEEEWEAEMSRLKAKKDALMSEINTLKLDIDNLKSQDLGDPEVCIDELYQMVGANRADVDNFRKAVNELSGIVVTDKPDTTAPKLYRTNPNRNGTTDFKNPEILLYFDDAIANKEIKSVIQFSDTSKNEIAFSVNFIDDATLSIKPEKDLKPEINYEIKIDLSKFLDAAGNKIDSSYSLKFSTITGVEFTGLSGKVMTSKKNVVVVLQDSKDSKKYFTALPDKTSTYSFERISAGVYSLWIYSDTDSSKTFSMGYPDPFKYSEEFYFAKDTLKLLPRWSVTDLDIVFE